MPECWPGLTNLDRPATRRHAAALILENLMTTRALNLFLLFLVFSASVGRGNILLDYLKPGETVRGNIVTVVPPEGIHQYLQKVDEASRKDPAWFEEHAKKAAPGVPLPYDPKLGLNEDEYAEYLKLWGARKFVSEAKVSLSLKQVGDGLWQLAVSGPGMPIRLLRYQPEGDSWTSTNGTLKRIDDINADERSILRGWTGQEWKMEKEDSFVKAKENFAIGREKKGKHGLLVYRYQEVDSDGRRVFDRSMVIRFAPVKAEKKKK